MVRVAFGQINLPQLYFHTGGDLHGSVSELTATCACWSFRSAVWSSRHSSDLASVIYFSSCRWPLLVTGARWFLWSEYVSPEVLDLPFFSDFIDRRRQVLVQDSTGTSPGRRATTIGALLCLAGMFTDSQSLISDGVFLDLAMVEARFCFWSASQWR
jgi:hypothetical protein